MKYGRIISTGKYLPPKVLTNKDLEKIVDTSDEWIYTRTGIKNRRIAIEKNYEMATKAAVDALEGCNIKPEEIDLIVVATMSSEYSFPAVACLVQKEIGATNAMAFDLSAACSGFIFALSTVNQYIKAGTFKNALVIGVEKLSHLINWEDRNTSVLFGDGAGAAIVIADEQPGILEIECKSVGSKYECLTAMITYNQTPFYEQEKDTGIKMDGREVLQFVNSTIPKCINHILEKSNIDKYDIDYYIMHQANIRIIEKIAKKLGIDLDKFYTNIDKYGNTSAASVAIALDEMFKNGDLVGKKVVMAGFGAGLTYGATILQF